MFIRPTASDDSSYPSANTTYDGVLAVTAPLPSGHWTQPAAALRGGFRYLTVVSNADAAVTISNVSCAIAFMPHVDDLRDYAGYFFADDPVYTDKDFLTKVWYAGAYTVQTNTVALNTGRQVPIVKSPGEQYLPRRRSPRSYPLKDGKTTQRWVLMGPSSSTERNVTGMCTFLSLAGGQTDEAASQRGLAWRHGHRGSDVVRLHE